MSFNRYNVDWYIDQGSLYENRRKAHIISYSRLLCNLLGTEAKKLLTESPDTLGDRSLWRTLNHYHWGQDAFLCKAAPVLRTVFATGLCSVLLDNTGSIWLLGDSLFQILVSFCGCKYILRVEYASFLAWKTKVDNVWCQ